MKRKVFIISLLSLIIYMFATITVLAAPKLQNAYEAYGLSIGDEDLNYKMMKNPPSIIVLKPIEYRIYNTKLPMDTEALTIEKGEESSFNFSWEWESTSSIDANVIIRYCQSDDSRVILETEHNTHVFMINSTRLEREPDKLEYAIIDDRTYTDRVSTFLHLKKADGTNYKNPRIIAVLGKGSAGAGNVGEITMELVGVKLKKGIGIVNINTDASKTGGETSVPVATAIVIGLAGVAAAVTGSSVVGTSGASGASDENSESDSEKSTYKMIVYKEFGNKIKYDDSPVFVYARMVETNYEGVDIERLDLTEQIEIFSDDSFMEIGSATISGDYMGASVRAYSSGESDNPKEGIISFQFSGEGGVFQNNVKFKMIGEPYISLEGPNLYVLATSAKSFEMSYKLQDFLNEAEVTINALQDTKPFDLKLSEDKEGNRIIVATDLEDEKPIERFFESYSCEIIAENEKEYARTVFNVVMCYEGLLPDFLGKPKEIRGYKDEEGEMEETLVAFKLGLWNESSKKLDFVIPENIDVECSDEKGVFDVIGLDYKQDMENTIEDAISFKFKAEISLPALDPIEGELISSCSYNGKDYENNTDIKLIPDILQYEDNFEKEYENCIYIINTYLPERFRDKKLNQLEKAKDKLGIEDLKLFRKNVWQIAQRAIMQEKEQYLIESYWYDEAIAYAELVKTVGDLAFDIVLSSVGGPLAGFAAAQAKGAFLDFVSIYVEKPSIGMPELQEFLEKRFIQMVGQSDGAFETPGPKDYKKLAAWLSCYVVYRIVYHWWYDKDKHKKPIGFVEAIKRGIYDMSGKSASILLSDYIKNTELKTAGVKDFVDADQKLFDDSVKKTTEVLSDFIDRIKNGGIQFT